jgi:hypothetical protein
VITRKAKKPGFFFPVPGHKIDSTGDVRSARNKAVVSLCSARARSFNSHCDHYEYCDALLEEGAKQGIAGRACLILMLLLIALSLSLYHG